MATLRTIGAAAALALLAACTASQTNPAAPTAGQPAEAAAPTAPKPAEAPAPAKAEPSTPAAPAAPAAAATPPAAPVPPAPPPVAAPKKRTTIALGLPNVAALKETVGFDNQQAKAAKAVYDGYKTKLDEAVAKVKGAADKKAANKEVAPLRAEIQAKIREICSNDAQRAKFDELTAPKKKKAAKT